MRFSSITLALFTLSPLCLAAPVRRGFFGDVGQEISNIAHSNATLSGIASTVKQSISNPQLTVARIQVVKGLSDVSSVLSTINSQASSTGNDGVVTLVNTARAGVTAGQQGINNIGQALISGTTPSTTDQKNVAVGIKQARDAVNQMAAAMTTADATLTSDIAKAQTDVTSLQEGGQGVLAASGISLSDLGLSDDFAN